MGREKGILDHEFSKFTVDNDNNSIVRVIMSGGQGVNPLSKYVEATYSNGDMTVVYSYFESPAKATLFNTIILNYTEAQDTTFVSAQWA